MSFIIFPRRMEMIPDRFEIVPPAPGAGPMDWNLQATQCGETRTLFKSYVRLDPPTTTQSTDAAFPDFDRLPAELQVHVLSFCSSATLFRVMQTCVTLRHEASKLFWSHPDSWYAIDGKWLFAGGFAGEAYYAPDFLQWVQHLEVGTMDMREVMPETATTDDHDKRINEFWRVVQRLFPRLVRVVISQDWPRYFKDIPPSLERLKKVVQKCPSGVEVSASLITSHGYIEDRTVRIRGRFGEDGWEVTDPEWVRQSVHPPPKVWRGPVGTYAQIDYLDNLIYGMWRAKTALMIEAIERSQFNDGEWFECPGYKCNDLFFEGRAWAIHAVETRHWNGAYMLVEHKEFTQLEQRVENMRAEHGYMTVRKRYREATSQEKKEIERETLNQLESDPDYATSTPPEETEIWKMYQSVKEFLRSKGQLED